MRHLMGNETVKIGVVRVFNMFQHKSLNKRLVYVFLEGMLETLFPQNKFNEIFHKLHSKSQRQKSSNCNSAKDPLCRQNSGQLAVRWHGWQSSVFFTFFFHLDPPSLWHKYPQNFSCWQWLRYLLRGFSVSVSRCCSVLPMSDTDLSYHIKILLRT